MFNSLTYSPPPDHIPVRLWLIFIFCCYWTSLTATSKLSSFFGLTNDSGKPCSTCQVRRYRCNMAAVIFQRSFITRGERNILYSVCRKKRKAVVRVKLSLWCYGKRNASLSRTAYCCRLKTVSWSHQLT